MILDKLEELLNFPVFNINISIFKAGALEVKTFEDAVSLLDVKSVSFECSHDEFKNETAKYEKVKKLSQLSPIARNDVSRSVWQKFLGYKDKYEQLDSIFKGRANKKDALILKIKMLNLFPETGKGIPRYSDILNRIRVIETLDKEINELTLKSEFLPSAIIEKFNEIKNNCNVCYTPWSTNFTGKGEIKSDNDIYYCGEIETGRANGKGELYYLYSNERDNYYGDVVNGSCQGNGVLVYRNGDVYEGNFNDNYPEGNGKITYKNGNIYEGEFRKGKRNGYGKLTGSEIYEGHWEEDKKAPTPTEASYWDGVKIYDEAKRKSRDGDLGSYTKDKYQEALYYFNRAKSFLNSADYISKCEQALKNIKKQEQTNLTRFRLQKASVYVIQILLLAVALAAEFLFAMWLGKIGHIWYTMWTTFAISGIYFAVSNRVHDNHGAWIVISAILVIVMNITAVCLYTTFYWGIVFLVIFNTAISITLCVLMDYVDDLQELICSVSVIPVLLLYAATLGGFILSKTLMTHFYITSNMWHALWISPVILIVYSLVFALLMLWIQYCYDIDDDEVVNGVGVGILIPYALTIFLRVAITVGSFAFSVGIFFFCVLLFVIHVVAFFIGYGIYAGITGCIV